MNVLAGQIAQTQGNASRLEQSLSVATATVATQRQSLDGLQLLASSLRAQLAAHPVAQPSATLAERLNGLAVSLEVHQALSSNLGKQIDALESMKATLTTTNAELDGLIVTLKAENDVLRTHIGRSERALKSHLIDMALSMSNVPANFKVGALNLSAKALLLDGIDGLRLSVLAQARGLAEEVLANAVGLSSSSAGRLLLAAMEADVDGANRAATDFVAEGVGGASGQMLAAMLNNDPSGVRQAALHAVLNNVDSLSQPQRQLIEHVLFEPRSEATTLTSDMRLEIATRISADSSIDAARAQALRKAMDGDHDSDPILRSLEFAPNVEIAAADPSTTRLTLVRPTDSALASLAHLPLIRLVILGQVTDKSLQAVSKLKALKELELSWTSLDPNAIAVLSTMTSLTYLSIPGRSNDDHSLDALSAISALTSLSLVGTSVTGTGIAASQLASRLTVLNLDHTSQSGSDMAALATMPNLVKLDVYSVDCSAADLAFLASSPSLQEVIVEGKSHDADKLNKAVGRQLFRSIH